MTGGVEWGVVLFFFFILPPLSLSLSLSLSHTHTLFLSSPLPLFLSPSSRSLSFSLTLHSKLLCHHPEGEGVRAPVPLYSYGATPLSAWPVNYEMYPTEAWLGGTLSSVCTWRPNHWFAQSRLRLDNLLRKTFRVFTYTWKGTIVYLRLHRVVFIIRFHKMCVDRLLLVN